MDDMDDHDELSISVTAKLAHDAVVANAQFPEAFEVLNIREKSLLGVVHKAEAADGVGHALAY